MYKNIIVLSPFPIPLRRFSGDEKGERYTKTGFIKLLNACGYGDSKMSQNLLSSHFFLSY